MNKFYAVNKSLVPKRATIDSAGYDFFAPHDFIVPAHGTSDCIDSGVSIKLDDDKVLMCYVRSSYGFKHNTRLINGTGVVDAGYFPNTIKCILKNDSDEDLVVHQGDRYMQGVIMQFFKVDDEEEVTTIRNGGLGSTGL